MTLDLPTEFIEERIFGQFPGWTWSWYMADVLPETDLEIRPIDVGNYDNNDNDGDNEELQYRNDRSATSEINSE
jgi:hypothetical protein